MLKILPEHENPALREKAAAVPASQIRSKRVQGVIKQMKALLAKEEFGVALAAPQVGESIRLFIVSGRALARGARNAPDEPNEKGSTKEPSPLPDQIFINPEILKVSRAKTDKHEGCLSIRGLWGEVPRAEKVTLRALNEHGEKITRGAAGFLAHIFQHEMDHLEGILYTDKATKLYEEHREKK